MDLQQVNNKTQKDPKNTIKTWRFLRQLWSKSRSQTSAQPLEAFNSLPTPKALHSFPDHFRIKPSFHLPSLFCFLN